MPKVSCTAKAGSRVKRKPQSSSLVQRFSFGELRTTVSTAKADFLTLCLERRRRTQEPISHQRPKPRFHPTSPGAIAPAPTRVGAGDTALRDGIRPNEERIQPRLVRPAAGSACAPPPAPPDSHPTDTNTRDHPRRTTYCIAASNR